MYCVCNTGICKLYIFYFYAGCWGSWLGTLGHDLRNIIGGSIVPNLIYKDYQLFEKLCIVKARICPSSYIYIRVGRATDHTNIRDWFVAQLCSIDHFRLAFHSIGSTTLWTKPDEMVLSVELTFTHASDRDGVIVGWNRWASNFQQVISITGGMIRSNECNDYECVSFCPFRSQTLNTLASEIQGQTLSDITASHLPHS